MFGLKRDKGGTRVQQEDNILIVFSKNKNDYFLLNGQRVGQPQKGLQIIKRGNKARKVLIK